MNFELLKLLGNPCILHIVKSEGKNYTESNRPSSIVLSTMNMRKSFPAVWSQSLVRRVPPKEENQKRSCHNKIGAIGLSIIFFYQTIESNNFHLYMCVFFYVIQKINSVHPPPPPPHVQLQLKNQKKFFLQSKQGCKKMPCQVEVAFIFRENTKCFELYIVQ